MTPLCQSLRIDEVPRGWEKESWLNNLRRMINCCLVPEHKAELEERLKATEAAIGEKR